MKGNLGVNVSWIKHLKTKEDQQSFIDNLAGNPVVARLVEILEAKLAERDTFKEMDYSSPSWAYLAADRNGYTRAINEVVTLLQIKERE